MGRERKQTSVQVLPKENSSGVCLKPLNRRLLTVQKVRAGYCNLLLPGWVGTDRENSTLMTGEVRFY